MRTFILLTLLTLSIYAEESYLFQVVEPTPQFKIHDDTLLASMPIKRIDAPRAQSISAYHQGLGKRREYQIQITLAEAPPKGFRPQLKLGDDVLAVGVRLSTPTDPKFASSIHIESDDKDKIITWVKLLQKVFNVTDDRVETKLDK